MGVFERKLEMRIALAIFIGAAVLRLLFLSGEDVVGDDATYAFRSIGYFDHMVSQIQTTPLQWFSSPPWWSKLSFHDHPPLAFFVHYIFFGIFGVSTFVSRFPDALLGIGSVVLLFFFSRYLLKPLENGKGENKGAFMRWFPLCAAFFLAFDPYHVWTSRRFLLESTAVFFSLAAAYATLLAVRSEKARSWFFAGGFTAAALMSKYTAFFVAPACVVYGWFVKKRGTLRKGVLFFVSFVAVFSPVIIYNAMMYASRGHFDLQIASLMGNAYLEWPSVAKEVVWRPVEFFLNSLRVIWDNMNPLTLVFAVAGIGYAMRDAWRKRGDSSFVLPLLILGFFFLQFTFLAPARRLLPIVAPWIALFAGLGFAGLIGKWIRLEKGKRKFLRAFAKAAVSAVVVWVIAFGYISSAAPFLVSHPLLSARAASRDYYGFEELGRFIEDRIQKDAFVLSPRERGMSSALFIWDEDINYFPKMWYIQRWVTYARVPFASSGEWTRFGEDFFRNQGYSRFYFIRAKDTLLVPGNVRTGTGAVLEEAVVSSSLSFPIFDKKGNTAFIVYSW